MTRPEEMSAGTALFDAEPRDQALGPGAMVLGGFARDMDRDLLAVIEGVLADAPPRHLVTPGGRRMSVAMSNCGGVGWVSDRRGYRYDPIDPESGRRWPAMPDIFTDLAVRAAAAAGFAGFAPDACLINRYEPGARLSLHQDRDERDRAAPIVSVSLGLPATFLWGGEKRSDRPRRIRIVHGDVTVWGGPARFAFHGVEPVADGAHPLTGRARYNLTFRKVF
ncbi:MAG: DNA oxidative demethylase AlkB [Sphingomonas sp.]|nr:DNA oxidative demethylase AlkB [Sphingomonas sp.]MDX3886039.1 DNA oxidative demethylase AlkB [Sphingomonas sp.]